MKRCRVTAVLPWTIFFCSLCPATALGQSSAQAGSKAAQSANGEATDSQHSSANQLERDFFAILRAGDAQRFLTYVPEGGVNAGSKAGHLTRAEVEDQITHHNGLYCKLFDSACIQPEIRLDDSSLRACSYRELLTKSKDVHTAVTETTRNGVRQAILVARMKNDNCAGVGLIDFIFNLQADGWKLFSIP